MTNYGLGGLCEVHVDPHGMMESESLPKSRQYLKYTGMYSRRFLLISNIAAKFDPVLKVEQSLQVSIIVRSPDT